MNRDIALLTDVVVEAGKLAVAIRRKGLKVRNKPGGSPVTNGDTAVNELLRERLLGARPDYGWQSEEDPDDPSRLTTGRVFVVDPIDGTSSYMSSRDYWAVSVAIVENGRPISGVVFAPSMDQFFEAAVGEGAMMDGRRIQVTGCPAEEGCNILADPNLIAHPEWPTPWPKMNISQRNSIAYRMCLVASGEFDACFAPSPKHDWDLAAGDLILQEAGGLCTDHAGRIFQYNTPDPVKPSLVCAGPALHPLLLARVRHTER